MLSFASTRDRAPFLHAALVLFATCVPAGPVKAGAPEALTEILVRPRDPRTVAIRYNNAFGGLMLSDDGGRSFRIRPGLTFTRSGVRQDASFAMTADGAIFFGGSDGLFVLDADGCNPAKVTGSAWSGSMTLHPRDPGVLFFVTSHGAMSERTGLWKRDARGVVLALGPDDSLGDGTDFTTTGMRAVTVEAAMDQVRIVQTGTRVMRSDAGTKSVAIFRFTDDYGMTWVERTIPAPLGSGTPRLLAVDARRPQLASVAITVDGYPDPPDIVLITRDGGDSFVSYIEGLTSVGQAHSSLDGRFWVADVGDPASSTPTGGLWFAKQLGDEPEQVLRGVGILAVAEDPNSSKLWISEDYSLALFDPETRTRCRVFDMNDTKGFVLCPAENLAKNSTAKEQMCLGFCGALHFAAAPLCSLYNDQVGLCGKPGAEYDKSVGWENPAGPAERCAGFPPTTEPDLFGNDVAPVADAGVSEVEDAGTGMTSLDGSADAALDQEPVTKRNRGCALGRSAPRDGVFPLLLLLLFARRRSRGATGGCRRMRLVGVTVYAALGCGEGASDQADAAFLSDDARASDSAADAAPIDDDSIYGKAVCAAGIPSSANAIDALGASGAMRAKVVSADFSPPRKYYNNWAIQLSAASGEPLLDATFSKVQAWMPVHGHNGRFPPTITAAAEPGTYDFNGVHFTMTGPWQLKFDVAAGVVKDSFALDVCVGD